MNAAPLLVSFSSEKKYIEALPNEQQKKYSVEIQRLIDQSLPPVVSPYCLAILFGYSLKFVYAMSSNQKKFYRCFEIKQGNKKRKIHSPKISLKAIQKWLGFHLNNAIEFPPHVCGFVKGRSFFDAAKQHIGSRWVHSVDITDFFPSISRNNITSSLASCGYSEKASELIADLCCLEGRLAQGSPASPVLSNICMKETDSRLLNLAEKHGIKVTRYADDIVLSGTSAFNPEIEKDLYETIEKDGFKINKNKTYFSDSSKGQRLKVHGLLIKEDKISLTKGYRNKIRTYKHIIKTKELSERDLKRIKGHIEFSEFIERKNQYGNIITHSSDYNL